MTRPTESQHKRMVAFWRTAYGASSNPGERVTAFAKLKRLQRDLDLSDVDAAFICESTIAIDSAPPEAPLNVLRHILAVFEEHHVVFPSLAHAIVVALWVLHTWVCELFLHSPRLLVQSLEPECGKTTLLMCLEQLVRNGEYSDDFSPATLYRQLKNNPHTLYLFDEIDNSSLFGSDPLLRKFANAGHRQGGNVKRVIDNEVVTFPCFGPLAMAGIAKYRFPAPLLTRSIVIDMEKRLEEGRDEIWPNDPKCAAVRIAAFEWAARFKRFESVSVPFRGRAGNNGRVLIEIAESLGYGETARFVARAIHRPEDDPVVRLLRDIHQIFTERKIDRIWIEILVPVLHKEFGWDETWPDGDEDPRPLTRGDLLRMLTTKKIFPGIVWRRVKGQRAAGRGFLRGQFEPVWRQLFPGTAAQPSNVIALPRHRGGTTTAQGVTARERRRGRERRPTWTTTSSRAPEANRDVQQSSRAAH